MHTFEKRTRRLQRLLPFVLIQGVLTTQGWATDSTSTQENYSEAFAWERDVSSQSYDARHPVPVMGWSKRTLDFKNSTAREFQVLCYPGYDEIEIESFFNQQASWTYDLTGAMQGKQVYQNRTTFEQLANGESLLYFGNKPTRRVSAGRTPNTGDIKQPQWVLTYSDQNEAVQEWTVEKIATDLYLISLGGIDARNMLAVVGKTGWVILGQSFNDFGYMQNAYQALTVQTGKTEVEAIFADHMHEDHYDVSGYFIKLGAKLIINEASLGQLAARGIQPEPNSLLIFSDTLQYRAGETDIEFHEVPNSHALGLGFAWLPEHRILYQGDAISIALDSTLAPAMPLTRELAEYLNQHNIVFDRSVGNHQSPDISWEQFSKILQMPRPARNPDFPSCEAIQKMLANT
ncbi:MAG: hypothetical protein ACR2PS_14040 [Pseudomonadales bacterium]